LVYCKMSVGSTHHLEMVFVWKQNYILVDEYFFFCCTWIVNSAKKKIPTHGRDSDGEKELTAVAEDPQQHQEQVDEVQIQG
ncbi:hypothetical protein OIU05_15085, partial [Escherichia coli]|uniref:hypothetical protein n=1 Tax=Escherichia coli TaxID=562 RepID=UPI002350D2BE